MKPFLVQLPSIQAVSFNCDWQSSQASWNIKLSFDFTKIAREHLRTWTSTSGSSLCYSAAVCTDWLFSTCRQHQHQFIRKRTKLWPKGIQNSFTENLWKIRKDGSCKTFWLKRYLGEDMTERLRLNVFLLLSGFLLRLFCSLDASQSLSCQSQSERKTFLTLNSTCKDKWIRLSVCGMHISRTLHLISLTLGMFSVTGPRKCSVTFTAVGDCVKIAATSSR